MKTLLVRFGLVSGLALVVLTLVAVAIINLPQTEGAYAHSAMNDESCPVIQVAQDAGYGVTKTVARHDCGVSAKR